MKNTPTAARAEGKVYYYVKWLWLLTQCAMPVLAVLYVVRFMSTEPESLYFLFSLRQELFLFLLASSGSLYLVLWLIAESLLGMYRFPLKLPAALLLLGGFFIQFIVLSLTGGSPFFAAFTGIYITMAAIFASVFIFVLSRIIRVTPDSFKSSPLKALTIWLGAVFGAVILMLPLVILFSPLWYGFRELNHFIKIINGTIIILNTFSTMKLLKGFTVFGHPDPLDSQYIAEWQKWAPQTIVLLILAVTTAVILGGILSATGNS